MTTPVDDQVFLAAIDCLRRTGAQGVQIRYSDDEDPIVWMVVVEYEVRGKRPVPKGKGEARYYDADAGMSPRSAAVRLLARMVDAGECAHCGRPSAVSEDPNDPRLGAPAICWYVYDPELKTFRRSCEGDKP